MMLGSSSSPWPFNHKLPIPNLGVGPTSITSAAALRLGTALHRRLQLGFFLNSSLKDITRDVPQSKEIWHERTLQLAGFNCFQWSYNAFSSTIMSLSFFNGEQSKSDFKASGNSYSKMPRNNFFRGRKWTNILLAANILVFIAQTLTDDKVLFWGAKINSLIDAGQLWRLVTSSFLHANVGHLMVNCYSLNSVGPTVENICGPRRYLAIYLASAIASASTSYWFSKAPAVGASGAIFGLVGSFGLFVLRHRAMVKGSERDLQHIAQVVVLNMAIGLLSQGIDNWGHVGGLLGGAAISWLLGPVWEVDSVSHDGQKFFIDKAPIFSLVKRGTK